MARAFGIAALVAGLMSCATGQTVMGPDGQLAIEVRCHHDPSYCTMKADRICGGRYHVLDNGVRPRTVVLANGTVSPMQPIFHGYMVVRCH